MTGESLIGRIRRVFRPDVDEGDEDLEEALEREEITWRETFAFLWRLMVSHPLAMGATIVLGLGIAASEVVSVSLILPFLDTIGGSSGDISGQTRLAFLAPYLNQYPPTTKIRIIAVGFFGIQAFKQLLRYGTGRIGHYLRIAVDRDLRTELFEQMVEVDLSFIHQEKVGNLITVLHSYPTDVARTARRILNLVPRIASFLGYLVVLLLLSWQLTVLALGLAYLANKSINFINEIVRRMGRELNVYRVRLKQVSLEALKGMRVTRLFNRQDYMRARFQEDLRNYQRKRYEKSSLDAAVQPIYSTAMTGMFALTLVAGTYLLEKSASSWVLILSVFMTVILRIMGPATKFAKTKNKVAGRMPSVEEVIDFQQRDDKPFMEDGDVPFRGLDEGIRFESVDFRYGEEDPKALEDVSFQIPKGSTVALVGSSGAGKSTAMNLIARLYDPTAGRITVDGRDLRDLQVGTWRDHLAMVSQDTFLFNDTVRENIRFGDLDASDEKVEWAAKQANAHGFIQDLPQGYETGVGERGVRLSGGQAQRVAIARALLADPEILLLDEATSALDTATERQVQAAIDRLSEDRTVVAIAHRLSTVQDADEIVVLEDGQVVERGAHEELLGRKGTYWRYVRMQDLFDEVDAEPADTEEGERKVVLRPGDATATFEADGRAREGLQVLTAEADRDPVLLLREAGGDGVVLQEGQDTTTVRVGDVTYEGVPIVRRRETAAGVRETRMKVRALEDEAEPGDRLSTDQAPDLHLEPPSDGPLARLRRNGDVLGEVPLVRTHDGEDPAAVLAETEGDVAVASDGAAEVRLGSRRFEDVPVGPD